MKKPNRKTDTLYLEHQDLPMTIIFKGKDGQNKEYVLKTNKEKAVTFLNKKEVQ
jgi:hypothetical protein